MNFKDYLKGELLNEAKVDTRVSADFDDKMDLKKTIIDHPKLLEYGRWIYFDGADLVMDDKTIIHDLVAHHGWDIEMTINDIQKILIKNIKIVQKAKKASDDYHKGVADAKAARDKALRADASTQGRFNITMPTAVAGTNGSLAVHEIPNPRMIIDVKEDEDVALIKKELKAKGVKIRPMKRKNGTKIYVDTQTPEQLTDAIDKLAKL